MNKSYLEACSPVLYPRMTNGEAAGMKHPNLEQYSMIGAMVFTVIVLIVTFLIQ